MVPNGGEAELWGPDSGKNLNTSFLVSFDFHKHALFSFPVEIALNRQLDVLLTYDLVLKEFGRFRVVIGHNCIIFLIIFT